MSVNSQENRKMIWELLSDEIPKNEKAWASMQNFINTTSDALHRERFTKNRNIMEMNKILLKKCKLYLQGITRDFTQTTNRGPSFQSPSREVNIDNRDYDKFTTKKERSATFENILREKQDNYNKLLEGEKPKSINFSQEVDKPISTMSSLLDETMAAREKELQSITTKYNKSDVTNWITNGGDTKDDKIKINEDVKGILKPIALETSIPPLSSEDNSKRVTFSIEEKESTQPKNIRREGSKFLARLKQRAEINNTEKPKDTALSTSSNLNIELLHEIIKNQQEIMKQQKIILEKLEKSDS